VNYPFKTYLGTTRNYLEVNNNIYCGKIQYIITKLLLSIKIFSYYMSLKTIELFQFVVSLIKDNQMFSFKQIFDSPKIFVNTLPQI